MGNLFSASQFGRKTICSIFFNFCFIFLFFIYSSSSSSSSVIIPPTTTNRLTYNNYNLLQMKNGSSEDYCFGVHDYTDYDSKCVYVKSHSSCLGKGFINYLEIFYCNFGRFPLLGYILLLCWLLILFYLVGNTTSEYFVPSVEGLSAVLNLSPTISGTTLLPLGNGANDVFASIISFTKSHNGDVGFNGVLGGVFFISCFVVGIVAISSATRRQSPATINEASFVRDVIFLILALFFLLIILISGRINLIVAICYLSLYFAYIGVVSGMHFFSSASSPSSSSSSEHNTNNFYDDEDDIRIPLIIGSYVDEEKSIPTHNTTINSSSSSSYCDDHQVFGLSSPLRKVISVLELPLYLPRRITIPVVKEEKWSKVLAVSSAILSPALFAAVWGSQFDNYMTGLLLYIYLVAGFLGLALGYIAFNFTKKTSPPPKECQLPWLTGGFLMSITWTYLIVEELVSLLISFGNIFEISPSLLGLTVLAWGNSLGDLISNVTMALHDDDGDGENGGGCGGTQIAMSGCYAGPVFNILIGLGLSLVFASWKEYPSPYVIPRDTYLYEMVGFIIAALLWSLVILLKKNMQLDRYLGVGLLAIYMCFLVLTFARAFGFLSQS